MVQSAIRATPAPPTSPANECPYAGGNTLIADKTLCPANASHGLCVVDSDCRVVADNTYVNIGDLTTMDVNVTSLRLWPATPGGALFLYPNSILPDRIQSISIDGFSELDMLGFQWPRKLLALTYNLTGNQSYTYEVPGLISNFTIAADYITREVVLSTGLKFLKVFPGSEWSNMDCRGVSQVYVARPHIKLNDMVVIAGQLSIKIHAEALKSVTCPCEMNLSLANISSWSMDNETFATLNQASFTTTALDIPLGGPQKLYTTSPATSISTPSSDCNNSGDRLKELWSNRSSLPERPKYFVCVTGGQSMKHMSLVLTWPLDPSTIPAPQIVTPSPTMPRLSAGSKFTWTIVGVAIGSAVVLLSAVAFYLLRIRPRRRQRDTTDVVELSLDDESQLKMHDLELIRLNDKDLTLTRVVGSGAFATVWLGAYHDQLVAVKKLHTAKVTVGQLQAFVVEIHLMNTFESPYLVKLVGAAWHLPMDLKCVMEWMDGGDLRDYLATHSPATFSWADKMEHIRHIVEGLAYLHSLGIIHRDLKSRNILLDSTKGTKLTDFGVSKVDMQATMTLMVGTCRWMAPEVMQEKDYTVAADMFSFGASTSSSLEMDLTGRVGCILSEFSTHQIPYEEVKNPTTGEPMADTGIMFKVADGSLKPSFSPDCPDWIRTLAMKCLHLVPDERPTAIQVAHVIRTELKNTSNGTT
ncbi:Aste57867_4370 [Aphanomyces stellatus]|uniref:Aste57867_4370 protein n=1 Tax=Aphanomyces stellatus TaxID=120398 RepID=A0A485KGJ5_9STRA|nr:hypothetical protein As57867_004358 [Aphanomyces stellatus]VFT81484.1 Aste57867_4370 [Aphanomyces stellatus]